MAKLAHNLFLFLLVFALLAFGTTAQWSITLVEGLCFLLALLHLLNIHGEKSSLYAVPGMVPLALLAGFAIVQILPLPPLILKLISPNTWKLYAETVWVVRPDTWMPISVAPKSTLAEFFRLAAYATFYLMTVQLLDSRERLKKTASFFTTFIGLFSLAGILIFLLSKGRIFWFLGGWPFETETAPSLVLAANKNHYAGLMAMVLPVVFAQFLATRPQVSYSSLREKLVEIVRSPTSHPHILPGAFLVLLVASLFLSLSWGGILGSLASLSVFILLLLIRGAARKRGVIYGLYLVGILLAVAMAGWGAAWVKSDLTGSEQAGLAGAKGLVWKDSAKIVGDFPLLGTGFGTFADIYPRYKTTPMESSIVRYARNEYSEFMVEGGLVGTFLAGCFILSILRQTYPIWRMRHNRTSVYLYLGGLAGLVAILSHSFAGFAPHLGVVGLYFFFLAGLATAAALSRSRGGSGNERAIVSPVYLPPVGIAVTVLLLVSLAFNVGVLAGKGRFAAIASPDPAAAETEKGGLAVERMARQASRFDPLESAYRYALADAGLAAGEAAMTVDRFADALRLNPLNAEYLQRLGLVLANLGQDEKAERLLRAGVRNDNSDPERHKALAFWLLSGGRVEEGLEQVRQAIAWGPQKTREYLTLMSLFGLNDEEMRRILPEQSAPMLAYGDYLAGIGKEREAERSYRAAVRFATEEARPNPATFLRAAEFFTERKDYNEGLEVIQAGIEFFPENADLRFVAANLYERLGIPYRAEEEYRASLALDPGNEIARESLRKIAGESE